MGGKMKILKRILAVFLIILLFLGMYAFHTLAKHFHISKSEKYALNATQRGLLVLDLQKSFLKANTSYAAYAPQLLEKANRYIKKADSLGINVYYVTTQSKSKLINFLSGHIYNEKNPDTVLDERLLKINDNVFVKTKMDAFHHTDLDEKLRKDEIGILYIIGLDARYCVNKTAQAALKRGLQVVVLEDAVISNDEYNTKRGLEILEELGISLQTGF